MVRSALALLLALTLLGGAPLTVQAAPDAPTPALAFVNGSTASSTGIDLRVSWPPAAGTISRYQIQRRVDGGSWTSVQLASALARSATVRIRPWTTIRFRLRAYDGAGTAGPWTLTAPQWVSVAQESDDRIDYGSSWTTRTDSTALGGALRGSRTAGASAFFEFSGTHVAWVAQRGAKRGGATVDVDGQPQASVDLFAASKRPRRVVFSASWPEASPRSLQITVEGTAGRPTVEIDAFFTLGPALPAVLVGAGDIGWCGSEAPTQTAAIIEQIDGIAITLGDNAYPDGTAQQFQDCYGPNWGQFKARTRPTLGNHDYGTLHAAPYFEYFGAAAGQQGKGYYAYGAGTWRVYALNSECSNIGGCDAGAAQYNWLAADLAANPHRCVLAYWHRPRFSSGYHGGSTRMADITKLLYDRRADVVLASHDHNYERLARLNAAGNRNSTRGIRHFVVGTGGAPLYQFTRPPSAATIVRDNSTHGVLKVTLRVNAYDWEFMGTSGSFTDSGSDRCH
ncbi:MAG TPA: metallophosphoesterase [Candidatus Limnocylindria bacterium]|nr:metallophosphoesterase [Candidatus Limnocylindria bacterium]